MDPVTHFTLGAVAGEAVLGKRIGNKAPLIGGFAAILPDLDLVFSLFLHPVDYLSIHRGFTHSFFFLLILAPVLAYFVHRWLKKEAISFRKWCVFFLIVLFTHPLIDLMTGYGTQVFYPITRHAFEFNTIFIIDLFFTLPMLVCILVVMIVNRSPAFRKKWNYTGITVSLLYLLLTVVFKLSANQAFHSAIERDGIVKERMMTFPAPFAGFYWRALIEVEDGFYEGYYSLFEQSDNIRFYFIPRNAHKISEIKDSYAIGELLWFSKGYYHVSEPRDGSLYFNDLRFGSYLGFLGDYSHFVFSFKILENPQDVHYNISFRQEMQEMNISAEDFRTYFSKAFGR